MSVDPDTGPVQSDVGPGTRAIAQRINNRILQLQRTKVRVIDQRMPPTEIARERRPWRKMRRPVDSTGSPIEPLGVSDFEAPQLEEHAIGNSRLEARAVRHAQVPGEGNTGGALLRADRAESHQLTCQQIRQAARGARKKLDQPRSSHVV